MPKNIKDLQESAIHNELEKTRVAKEYKERLRWVQEQQEASARVRQTKISKDLQKKQESTEKNMQIVRDMKSGKNQSSNRSQEFGTFYSWIMNSVPEFEAIVKAICYNVHAKRKQYIGGPLTAMVGKGLDSVYYNAAKYFKSGDAIQLPDIKYVTDIDADGRLQLELMQDSFGDLLKNEDGSFDEETAANLQSIFQGYVNEWIDSLDGIDGEGYFIASMGNPPESRVYKKADGVQDASGKFNPRPECIHNFVKKDDYENLVRGLGHPEKSLSVFLQDKCHDVNIEEVRTLRL